MTDAEHIAKEKPMMQLKKEVEVSQDELDWLLVFARNIGRNREGEPVTLSSGDVRYFKTESAANAAAKKINRGVAPLTAAGHIAF
jgi:hypothetical protein